MHDDAALLRRFAEDRDQRAFGELVERHLHLVYFAALRQTAGDSALAQDAAQDAFLRLAARAAELRGHPSLAGWLHTTACHCGRERFRAEQRRRQRELTAGTMRDHEPDANDETWRRVRPVIDDALLDLPAADRTAVLLRFFENRTFGEIGAVLGIAENSARMRTERALEKLQGSLGQRGVVSTAAALGTALAAPAALAVPAGLAPQVTSAALTAGGALGAGTTTAGVLHFMAPAKTLATVASVAALAAIGTAVFQQRQLAALRDENGELRQRQTQFERRLAAAETKADGRASGASPESAAAPSAAPSVPAPGPRATPVTAAEEPITHSAVEARYNRAKRLVKEGRHAEALAEFLWCYNVGMVRVDSYVGVRNSFLLGSLAELGKQFPPALAALQERRDAAEKRVVADASDRGAMQDYTSLNKALGEDERSLVVFDAIPRGDPRREVMAYSLAEPLIEARRYAELLESYPYSKMRRLFETTSDTARLTKLSAAQLDEHRRNNVKFHARNVEVLAGAGDFADAREFIGKLLAVDGSFETRTLIRRHLERAGHPELLPPAN